jgi:hypothetical protein
MAEESDGRMDRRGTLTACPKALAFHLKKEKRNWGPR